MNIQNINIPKVALVTGASSGIGKAIALQLIEDGLTVRQMLGWAHYRFSQVLANQAELTNTRLIEGSQAYTSKTCTK